MPLTRPRFNQFDTTISSISDPITVLNKSSTLANIDVGFIINRDGGTSSNVALFWQESSDSFVFALSANTGEVTDSVTNSNITISDYAKLTVGTLYGNIGGGSILPNVYITGSLIPAANVTYDLGSPTQKFRSAYFSGNTVYIGGESISVGTDGTWTFTSSGANVNLGAATAFNPPSANISGNVSASYFFGNGSQLTGIKSFSNLFVDGQNPIQADSISDTLTFVAGAGISISTDEANDSITFTTVSTLGAFGADGDFGLVTDAVLISEDQGDLASTNSTTYDLGTLVAASGLIYPDQLVLPSYTVTTLPSAGVAAQLIYISNESGGAVLAFSDGTNWRRVTDRAIVS